MVLERTCGTCHPTVLAYRSRWSVYERRNSDTTINAAYSKALQANLTGSGMQPPMPPEQKKRDRTSYYTMKTPGRSQTASSPSQAHSRSNSPILLHHEQVQLPAEFSENAPFRRTAIPPKLSPGVKVVAAQDARTPSPNYFGLAIEPTADPRDSAALPRDNWSPTSSVKSFGAALPKQTPLDANPEFEAFRRQVDLNKGRVAFNLSSSHFGGMAGGMQIPTASTPSALQRPRPPRWHTHDSNTSETSLSRTSAWARAGSKLVDPSNGKMDVDADSLHDSAYVSGRLQRNSEASLNPPSFLGTGRFESPAHLDGPFLAPEQRRVPTSQGDDHHLRLSMAPPDRVDQPTPGPRYEAEVGHCAVKA